MSDFLLSPEEVLSETDEIARLSGSTVNKNKSVKGSKAPPSTTMKLTQAINDADEAVEDGMSEDSGLAEEDDLDMFALKVDEEDDLMLDVLASDDDDEVEEEDELSKPVKKVSKKMPVVTKVKRSREFPDSDDSNSLSSLPAGPLLIDGVEIDRGVRDFVFTHLFNSFFCRFHLST